MRRSRFLRGMWVREDEDGAVAVSSVGNRGRYREEGGDQGEQLGKGGEGGHGLVFGN
jgi:hypothetical protein